MTIADRVATIDFRSWAPSTTTAPGRYAGRHRLAGTARMSLYRMLYLPRHLKH